MAFLSPSPIGALIVLRIKKRRAFQRGVCVAVIDLPVSVERGYNIGRSMNTLGV